ncbi:MAG TPA: hypothetical protein DHV96_12110 [Lachnospiraceae bacterium]|nr:hypothetical protein [Lachnospiraceae bacterium]
MDKTIFINALLDLRGEMNPFSRLRRFGKTLNMIFHWKMHIVVDIIKQLVSHAGREEKEQIETLIAGNTIEILIPNMEVRMVFERTIRQWVQNQLERSDSLNLYEALEIGDASKVQGMIDEQLKHGISFYDSVENFYHGFVTGKLNQS